MGISEISRVSVLATQSKIFIKMFNFLIHLLYTLACSVICFLDLLHSDQQLYPHADVCGKIPIVFSKIRTFANNFTANIEQEKFLYCRALNSTELLSLKEMDSTML